MGCSSSKKAGLEQWLDPAPLGRCQSMPGRAEKEKGARFHVVALTSSTLGSLKLNGSFDEPGEEKPVYEVEVAREEEEDEFKNRTLSRRHSDLSLEVFQAKTWSSMMEGRIPIMPRSPVVLPPPPLPRLPEVVEEALVPETINAWELMEGLEDSPLFVIPNGASHRSFSGSYPAIKAVEELTSRADSPETENGCNSPETSWHQLSPEDSVLSDYELESGSAVFPAPESESASSEPMTHQMSKEEQEVEQLDCIDQLGQPVVSPLTESKLDLLEDSLWHQMKLEDSLAVEFDIEIISNFRKAFDNLPPCQDSPSPTTEFELCKLEEPIFEQKLEECTGKRLETESEQLKSEKPILESIDTRLITGREDDWINTGTGIVKARVIQFQEKIDAKKVKLLKHDKCPPDGEDKVVLYFTSLRGVRKTFDDCCRVRLILKGYNVRVDDRDVSMHQRFRVELDEILGGSGWTLPRLFVRGEYLAGAEEVRRLHETGELVKMLEGFPSMEEGLTPCEACGDIRFVNCETCSGSCKVYCEEDVGGVFERCPDCNENGIIRCPLCCV